MLETLLKQADYTTKSTSGTSSMQPLLWNFGQPWGRFHESTENTSRLYPLEEDGEKILLQGTSPIPTLKVADRTRAHLTPLQPRQETLRRIQRSIVNDLLEPFTEKLRRIGQREDNWDNKGSLKPDPVAINKAQIILSSFLYAIIDSGWVWKTPFLSSDENGHITIQWNSGNQELHVEISEDTEEYIKIWGPNIEHEMYLGILKPSDYVALWDWLN